MKVTKSAFNILAVVGAAWTGYDIYASREQFEKELNTSLNNILTEARYNVHKQALEHATALMRQYQNIQEDIGAQTLTDVSKGER